MVTDIYPLQQFIRTTLQVSMNYIRSMYHDKYHIETEADHYLYCMQQNKRIGNIPEYSWNRSILLSRNHFLQRTLGFFWIAKSLEPWILRIARHLHRIQDICKNQMSERRAQGVRLYFFRTKIVLVTGSKLLSNYNGFWK